MQVMVYARRVARLHNSIYGLFIYFCSGGGVGTLGKDVTVLPAKLNPPEAGKACGTGRWLIFVVVELPPKIPIGAEGCGVSPSDGI